MLLVHLYQSIILGGGGELHNWEARHPSAGCRCRLQRSFPAPDISDVWVVGIGRYEGGISLLPRTWVVNLGGSFQRGGTLLVEAAACCVD